MKKILFGMLLSIAFTISANAQENKESAKKQSCCATKQQTASATPEKCHTDAAASTAKQGMGCSAQASAMTEPASTTQGTSTVVREGDRKACKADGSCCGAKIAEKA
jgi:hypothetical protein